jgi:NAD(P)-dependent dehydrogenase (short-subunit alcohol dehydrogenase family)
MPPLLLEGKVALVSGVGPGLGRQIALKFSAAGARVVLGARSEAYIEQVAAEVVASGGEAAYARCDITKTDDCAGLVALAEERFGGLDCLINNAFVHGPMDEPISGADIGRWREVFDVNVFGTMQMVQASIGALRRRTEGAGGRRDPGQCCGARGHVGSASGRTPQAGIGPYRHVR